jgi:hypothetical protein
LVGWKNSASELAGASLFQGQADRFGQANRATAAEADHGINSGLPGNFYSLGQLEVEDVRLSPLISCDEPLPQDGFNRSNMPIGPQGGTGTEQEALPPKALSRLTNTAQRPRGEDNFLSIGGVTKFVHPRSQSWRIRLIFAGLQLPHLVFLGGYLSPMRPGTGQVELQI